MPNPNDTLYWYQENAEAFIERTEAVDMSQFYRKFLTYVPSGGSILDTARQLKDKGAKDIFCLAPFGLFTGGLQVFDEAYANGIIKCVCNTNLIYAPEELKAREWYLQADMVPYVARIIDALNVDESVYDLINSTARLRDLASQIRIEEVFDEFEE